ncbi:MAG: rod shape-determining protein MreC [Clostridiales bacterium]|nr:rod shape-determining protein MreC [Clostridiales bacterium]
MKRLFRFRVFSFFVLAVIIAAITLISVNTSGNSGFVTNILTSLSKPLRSVAASVANVFESIYGYIDDYEKLEAENAELKAQLNKLQQDYRDSSNISAENERLRKLLELSSRHPDYKQYDTATIINWSSSNWSSSFTIGKGSYNSDIKVGDCVITEEGYLVGVVDVVETTSSTVITILDTRFSVGAYIDRTDKRYIAMGDFSLMKQELLKFGYMEGSAEIIADDTIITSGKGGILPAGLVIGTVQEVVTSSTGIDKYATIKPAADIKSLADVYLITSFEVSGDEN